MTRFKRNSSDDRTSKTRLFFVILVAIVFIGTAVLKIIGALFSKEPIEVFDNPNTLILIGILEIIIAIFWLIRKTSFVGFLLATSYMGGAIAVCVVLNQPFAIPIIVQVMIWIIAYYRFKDLRHKLLCK